MSQRRAAITAWVLFTVAVLNFVAFAVHERVIGGSAQNGKREKGRFYLWDRGRYTEVPERRWRAMRAHEVSVMFTHPLAIFVGGPLHMYARRERGPK
jgi:hypothetical protein